MSLPEGADVGAWGNMLTINCLSKVTLPLPYSPSSQEGQAFPSTPETNAAVGQRVSEKLEERDFREAVRLTSSEDSFASNSEATIAALKSKHPDPHPDSAPPEAVHNTSKTWLEHQPVLGESCYCSL